MYRPTAFQMGGNFYPAIRIPIDSTNHHWEKKIPLIEVSLYGQKEFDY